MAGFLSGLGAFGAGAAPGISNIADTIQQQQSSSDFGNALASIYGVSTTPSPQQNSPVSTPTSQPQAPQGGLQGILSALGGPLGSQQTAPSGSLASGSQPVPQPSAMGTTTPGLAGGIASQGGGLGGQPQAAQQQGGQNQQAQQPPQSPFQQPPQSAQPQQRPQAPQQGQLGSGPLDLATLVRNLTKQGVTGARLGNAVQRFIPLLNSQGLAQYRDLGLQLRSQQQQNLETQREYERNPKAQGSTAQNRVANQGMAKERLSQGQERIDAVQKRFEAREQSALDKLKSAKTDKEARDAKSDLDKVAAAKKSELQQQLSIINTPGADPEDQKAATAKVKELNQQLQDATDEAIKARRSGASQDKSTQAGPANQGGVVYGPDGKPMRYKGTGDRTDPKSYEAVQ